jgi:hypothetical protein
MEPKPKKKRVSGVGGKNKQPGFILREDTPGQIDRWRAAAERAGATSFSEWVRRTLDAAAERTENSQRTT